MSHAPLYSDNFYNFCTERSLILFIVTIRTSTSSPNIILIEEEPQYSFYIFFQKDRLGPEDSLVIEVHQEKFPQVSCCFRGNCLFSSPPQSFEWIVTKIFYWFRCGRVRHRATWLPAPLCKHIPVLHLHLLWWIQITTWPEVLFRWYILVYVHILYCCGFEFDRTETTMWLRLESVTTSPPPPPL